MSFTLKLLIISGVLWLPAIGFIIYAWRSHARQQLVLRYLAQRLAKIETLLMHALPPSLEKDTSSSKKSDETSHPETIITIDKNEPLSKYETVNLPDEIDINFVDR